MSSIYTQSIVFDHPSPQYLPGDVVSGKVIMENLKPLDARFVKISWFGASKTFGFWNSDKDCIVYAFNNFNIPWTCKDEKGVMPAGKYEFPFRFMLPQDCHPSFTGKNGKIEYAIKLEVARPWRFDICNQYEFFVTKEVVVPKRTLTGGTYGHWMAEMGLISTKGPAEFTITVSKTAVHPGETISVTCNIKNNSTVPITKCFIDFVSRTHFHSRPQIPCETPTLCPVHSNCRSNHFEKIGKSLIVQMRVEAFSEKQFVFDYTIPFVDSPSFKSPMITNQYRINFHFQCQTGYFTRVYTFPVMVGEMLEAEEDLKAAAAKIGKDPAPPPYS